MKTNSVFVCVILATLLLSACIPSQAPGTTITQPLPPTALPITEPTFAEPTPVRTTPTYTSGPEVVQLGDLTMEIYEKSTRQPNRDDGSFNTTAGPSSEILKKRNSLRDVVAYSQAFSPPPLNGRQLTYQLTYMQNQSSDGTASFDHVTVTFKLGDEEVLSVYCGVVGPVDPPARHVGDRKGLVR